MKKQQQQIIIGVVILALLINYSGLLSVVGQTEYMPTIVQPEGWLYSAPPICESLDQEYQRFRLKRLFTVTDTTEGTVLFTQQDIHPDWDNDGSWEWEEYYSCSLGTPLTLEAFEFTPMIGHNFEMKVETFILNRYSSISDPGTWFQTDTQYIELAGQPYCSDGICNGDETIESCPADCWLPPEPFCGDNICNGDETCASCPQDCGECPEAVCGDGICTLDENWQSCPQDCLIQGDAFPMWLLLLAAAFMIGKQLRWY